MSCSHKPHPRGKCYGSRRVLVWCDKCDAELVIPTRNKKVARREAKRYIEKSDNY